MTSKMCRAEKEVKEEEEEDEEEEYKTLLQCRSTISGHHYCNTIPKQTRIFFLVEESSGIRFFQKTGYSCRKMCPNYIEEEEEQKTLLQCRSIISVHHYCNTIPKQTRFFFLVEEWSGIRFFSKVRLLVSKNVPKLHRGKRGIEDNTLVQEYYLSTSLLKYNSKANKAFFWSKNGVVFGFFKRQVARVGMNATPHRSVHWH